jgi:hypothetical protein
LVTGRYSGRGAYPSALFFNPGSADSISSIYYVVQSELLYSVIPSERSDEGSQTSAGAVKVEIPRHYVPSG